MLYKFYQFLRIFCCATFEYYYYLHTSYVHIFVLNQYDIYTRSISVCCSMFTFPTVFTVYNFHTAPIFTSILFTYVTLVVYPYTAVRSLFILCLQYIISIPRQFLLVQIFCTSVPGLKLGFAVFPLRYLIVCRVYSLWRC